MPARTLASVLQLVIGVALLNVWLVRPGKSTAYRGGSARSLKQEFAEYGLPPAMFYIVGALKVLAGVVLLAALWVHLPVAIAAAVVAVLMVGAIAMHLKVKDPVRKSVPAVVMLALCVTLLLVG